MLKKWEGRNGPPYAPPFPHLRLPPQTCMSAATSAMVCAVAMPPTPFSPVHTPHTCASAASSAALRTLALSPRPAL
eukprot:98255-Chlamydomonas_euryale.AAC.1